MKILILHRIPYHKIEYHLGIDHAKHEVTYIGVETALENIPGDLPCNRIVRSGVEKTSAEVIAWLDASGEHFDRVISLSEYELMDAALVRQKFNITGALPGEVEKVRNKMLMKHEVLAAGLAAPRYIGLAQLVNAGGNAQWQGKTVLKPIDGASSEDVHIFDTPQDVVKALREGGTGVKSLCGTNPDLARFECEEFVQGPILHYDGLVLNGKVLILTGSKYIGTCLSYANGQPLGSVQFAIDARTATWVDMALCAVGIREGSFHLEAIENNGEPVFLEVANRVGGADVVASFELATGVHLPSMELKILIGDIPDFKIKIPEQKCYGWFVFPGHHLGFEYGRLLGHTNFSNAPQMFRWNQLESAKKLPKNITYQAVEAPAAGIVQGQSTSEVMKFMQQMFASVSVEQVNPPSVEYSLN